MKNYSIREDYVPRKTAETFVEDPSEYWNEGRIAASGYYQYYVYQKAAELIAKNKLRSFLDIGCGYPRKVRDKITPVTRDITLIDQPSMRRLMECDFPEMKFIPLDLESMDIIIQEKFDCVVCADVIEHLLNPDSLLSFIKKILSPDGLCVISTPERDIERGLNCLHSPKPEHVREWNRKEFVSYLRDSGLEVLEHSVMPKGKLSWIEYISLPLITRYLLNKRYAGCQTVVCKALS